MGGTPVDLRKIDPYPGIAIEDLSDWEIALLAPRSGPVGEWELSLRRGGPAVATVPRGVAEGPATQQFARATGCAHRPVRAPGCLVSREGPTRTIPCRGGAPDVLMASYGLSCTWRVGCCAPRATGTHPPATPRHPRPFHAPPRRARAGALSLGLVIAMGSGSTGAHAAPGVSIFRLCLNIDRFWSCALAWFACSGASTLTCRAKS